MAERFSALHDLGSLNFECWFNRPRNAGRSWVVSREELRFPYTFVPTVGGKFNGIGIPGKAAARARPLVLLTFHADLAVSPGLLQRFRPGAALAYYVERTFETWSPRHPAKEA